MNEEALHKTVVQFLMLALPDDVFWYHPANGEKRSKRTASKLKRMGVRPGVPDICIVHEGRALFIELKKPGTPVGNRMEGRGYLTQTQCACHRSLKQAGAEVVTCWSLEDVQDALRRWSILPHSSIGGLFKAEGAA
ncbi:VRR-NUC domain-containing protein [Pelagibius sp.]|uniref:VRR-NUC domain-containing protein n=1 Tax=Pelagibius sp. TaxID=1931238 RepID=UPI003BB19EBA